METKICRECGVEKAYTDYHKMIGCIGGVRSVCKDCRKIEKKEYSARPHVVAKQKDYYQLHKIELRKRFNAHYWTLNGQYHQYKKRAKKDNILFMLSQIDCIPFFNSTCTYCGSTVAGLGIDRVDNTKGYIFDNCTSCCKFCNWMKRDMSREFFLEHVSKIYDKNQT